MEYILNSDKPDGCIFCFEHKPEEMRERLVLARTKFSIVMLNRYPYTSGHLLIAPLNHSAELDDLSEGGLFDLFQTTRIAKRLLFEIARPDGCNIGLNLGKSAGAGIAEHMHVHIVPRWNGDTNFMTVIPDIRVMPENLNDTYDRFFPLFNKTFTEMA
jgi:ATP adenylyltransferase